MLTQAARSTADLAPQSDTASKSQNRSSPLYCLFNSATRLALQNEAMRRHPENRKARVEYRLLLERVLGTFYKAIGRLGCTHKVPSKAFKIMLTVEPWPRNEGAPKYTYRTFRRFMKIFAEGGVIQELDGLVIFTQWAAKTHFSQQEADAVRNNDITAKRQRFKRQSLSHRWQTIPANIAPQTHVRSVLYPEQKRQQKQAAPGGTAPTQPDVRDLRRGEPNAAPKPHPVDPAKRRPQSRLSTYPTAAFDAKMAAYDAEIAKRHAADKKWLDEFWCITTPQNSDREDDYAGATVNWETIGKILSEPLPDVVEKLRQASAAPPDDAPIPSPQPRGSASTDDASPDAQNPDDNPYLARAAAVVEMRHANGWRSDE